MMIEIFSPFYSGAVDVLVYITTIEGHGWD